MFLRMRPSTVLLQEGYAHCPTEQIIAVAVPERSLLVRTPCEAVLSADFGTRFS
jgi:hypothetical protein